MEGGVMATKRMRSARREDVDAHMQALKDLKEMERRRVPAEELPDASIEELRRRIEDLKAQVAHRDEQCAALAHWSARKSAVIVDLIAEMKNPRAVLAHQLTS
jgi:hypothetical protein